MQHETRVRWRDGMAFDVELQGHTVTIDAHPEFGGRNLGPTPKPLVLSALGGCTAMDVVSILGKMRVSFDALSVEVSGRLTDEHPKHYDAITITYRFTGNDIERSKVERAVKLSQEQYCGVSAMLRGVAAIDYAIVIEPPQTNG